MAVTSTLQAEQLILPAWVRARGLAIYTVNFMGTQAAGALLWGLAANGLGLQPAILLAAGVLLVGVVAGLVWRVPETGRLDVQPAVHWTDARLASAVAPADMDEGMAYQGGAHVFHGRRWAAVMTTEQIRRRAARGEAAPGSGDTLDVDAVLAHLPLAAHPLLDEYTPWYRDWLAHPTADAFWRPISPCAWYEQITAPVLNISG